MLFPRRCAFVLLSICLLAIPAWGQTLRVEVVDDTGTSSTSPSPFILLVGKSVVGVSGGPVVDFGTLPNGVNPPFANADTASPNAVTPIRVDQLQSAGYSVLSPYTGQMRPVYLFTVTTLGTGALMVFQNDGSNIPPFTYVNNVNPSTATANYRFDQCEFTYNATITSGANLTSIDAFSMPMQFELFTGTHPNLTQVDQRKYYLSTESMLAAFREIGAGQALYKMGTVIQPPLTAPVPVKGWRPTDGMAQFVRALGPGQAAAQGSLGDPAPYPSFARYLAGLASAAYNFTVRGSANSSTYNYKGKVKSDGNGGYEISLKGTLTPAPPTSLPPQGDVTVNLPINVRATATPTVGGGVLTKVVMNVKGAGYNNPPTVIINGTGMGAQATATVQNGKVNKINVTAPGTGYINSSTTVSIDPPPGSMDTFIYGATLSADSFSVDGVGLANTNNVYGAIARDALAAINFGYMNGVYGTDSRDWFGAAPTAFPFGRARAVNDGFYNPWAAVLYNNSDAYGFAFSDVSGPSPLMGLQAGQTLRVTLLPDQRLDSPKPVVTPGSSSLALQWPQVANATSYLINVLAPSGVAPVEVTAVDGPNSYTLNNLVAGAPYTITVAAKAMSGANELVSPAQPIQCSTTGTPPISVGSEGFFMAMSWIPTSNIASPPAVNFNGQTLTYNSTTQQWLTAASLNASLSGNLSPAGAPIPNQYVMTLTDHNNKVLFTNIISAVLTDAGNGQFNLPAASLYGNAPLTVGSNGPYDPISGAGANKLVLAVPFNPNPLKAFAPVGFPTLTYNQWVATFPGFTDNAPDADADGDGISNLMEYFQGSDPTVPGFFDTSVASETTTESLLTYRQSRSISGVTAQVEWSTDLQNWDAAGVITDNPQDVGNHLEFTAHVPRAGQQQVFTRLRVTLNQARPADGTPARASQTAGTIKPSKTSPMVRDSNLPPTTR